MDAKGKFNPYMTCWDSVCFKIEVKCTLPTMLQTAPGAFIVISRAKQFAACHERFLVESHVERVRGEKRRAVKKKEKKKKKSITESLQAARESTGGYNIISYLP